MDTNTIIPKEISTKKIADFVHHLMDDLSAAERVRMTYLGSQLGLYKAMAYAGPMNVGQLARRTGSSIKLVKHWVDSLATEGYLVHEPETDTFCLPAEHAIALTDPSSPYYIGSRFENGRGSNTTQTKLGRKAVENSTEYMLAETWRFSNASARFFSEEYVNSLFNSWLPSVEGLTERLRNGITVADLGCGRHGASTLVMAGAFPSSRFIGFDRYESSVERANLLAKEKHITNAHFELATAEQVYAQQYDLITLIECLNSMGDPQDLLLECYEVLKPDGVLIVAEAKDSSRVGEEMYQRMRASKLRPVKGEEIHRVELGVDGHEHELQHMASKAGFSHFQRVAETHYDKVYEMRP
ncbi:class I SAM-dependent methyltransferase [uncultured Pontibacter sp.]|uniref:class I SAM-dependent methyltransferase n=1 Tax=uncultured Pontibacter sp. TaxID=453356 RepID=UPI00261AE259|nr:class I SAM-dependent methyltransferase [uncultured Pontibacter sp.]